MTLYVVISVLILLLVAATCAAFTLGVLGELGMVRAGHCSKCDGLVVSLRRSLPSICMSCRHDHLAHPLRTMRHPIRELAHR